MEIGPLVKGPFFIRKLTKRRVHYDKPKGREEVYENPV